VPDITALDVYIFSLLFKTKFFANAVILLRSWNFTKQEVKTNSCSSCDRNRKMVILGLPAYPLSLNSLLSLILGITLFFTSRLLF